MNDSISTSSASSSTSSIVYNSMSHGNYNASNFNFNSLNSFTSSTANGTSAPAPAFSNNAARPYLNNNNSSPITNSSPSSSSAAANSSGNPTNSISPKTSPSKRTGESRPTDREPNNQRTPTNHSKQLSKALLFPVLSEVSKKYKRNSLSVRNNKVEAIEELSQAFERAELNCNGVCDFFVREIITNLTGHQI